MIDTCKLFALDSCEKSINKALKIVIYVDSADCSICQMRLPEWKIKSRELNKFSKSVDLFFIVNTKDYRNIKLNADFVGLRNLILYDTLNIFKKQNPIIKNSKFHTFLLGNNDQIILVGSPLHNDKLWNLYKRVIKDFDEKTINYE